MTQDDNGNTWLQGWCVRKGVTYRYYNYGLDCTADAVYTNLHLCLVEGDSVYVIPTKLSDRDDIETVIGDGIDYRCPVCLSFDGSSLTEDVANCYGYVNFLGSAAR